MFGQMRIAALTILAACGATLGQVGNVYWTETITGTANRIDTQGSNFFNVASGLIDPFAIDVDGGTGQVFFTDANGSIGRVNSNGTGLTSILNGVTSAGLGLAVDDVNKKVWFTDWNTGDVMNANYDGTGMQTVFNAGSTVGGLVIDAAGGKVYLATKGSIKSANINGTGLTTLYTPAQADFLDITLDPVNKRLYWTDNLNHKVQSSDLLGGNVKDVLTTGLATPIGIDLDPLLGEFYVANKGSSQIVAASLNGTNPHVLYNNPLAQTWGLAVVVPTPGTAALLGLGGLAVIRRRRR